LYLAYEAIISREYIALAKLHFNTRKTCYTERDEFINGQERAFTRGTPPSRDLKLSHFELSCQMGEILMPKI